MNGELHTARVELIAEAVREYGTVQFRAQGASMRPLMQSGDVLRIRREELQRIRFGEVAVFTRGGGIFAHRVIGSRVESGKRVLITKGDAFQQPDHPVRAEELLGRVTAVTRGRHTISLDTLEQRALGKLAGCVSACAPLWVPGARALKRIFVVATS